LLNIFSTTRIMLPSDRPSNGLETLHGSISLTREGLELEQH